MLRLSKLTDYAVVVLVRLSRGTGVQTSPGIAATTGIPEPTVAKVLKTLAAGGLVASQRGARGGYRLLRPLAAIPVADVIAAMDGPIALTACVEGSAVECESQCLCPMRGRWDPVNEAIQQALSTITLADMQEAAIPRAFRIPATAVARPPPNRTHLMSAATETLDTVQSRHPVRLQVGLGDRHRDGPRAQGAERGHHPADLRAQGGARLAAGLAAEGVSPPGSRWTEPHWARVEHPPIDYQDLHYYAAPKKKPGPKSLDEVDPELLRTYEKLGIPLKERAILAGVDPASVEGGRQVAVDAVFDSVSVATTFRETLKKAGVIFCPISEAVRDYPELVQQYLGSRRAGVGQLLRRAEFARCSPTAASSTSRRACAARWSCPPISASMRATPASSSAR